MERNGWLRRVKKAPHARARPRRASACWQIYGARWPSCTRRSSWGEVWCRMRIFHRPSLISWSTEDSVTIPVNDFRTIHRNKPTPHEDISDKDVVSLGVGLWLSPARSDREPIAFRGMGRSFFACDRTGHKSPSFSGTTPRRVALNITMRAQSLHHPRTPRRGHTRVARPMSVRHGAIS